MCEAVLKESGNDKVLAGWRKPFQSDGGIRVLSRNLETAIIKVSSVKPEYWHFKDSVLVFID